MTAANKGLTRRHVLATTGAGMLAAGLGARPAIALETVRQGYQTNMWGMPTYYLLRSGLLEKHGVKFEEFAVPSGNLTMQQMVARQVDMGTYAGPSFAIGHEKGGLVAIAMIEYVGKTARVLARKDLGITKVEQLKGKKVANQTGSSTGNIFVDQIATKAGLQKGDYQEIRMNVNDMVAAMAAKTVDAMVNVEPYNAIAEADGLAVTISEFYEFDKLPVFMAATPDFVDKTYASYGTGLDVRKGFTTTEDEFYRIAEATGGDSINLVHFGGDPDTPLEAMAEAVAGVSRRAAQRGLMIVFEFLPGTAVPDIDTAGRLARMVDDPNMKIMLDSRHLARSGGTLEDVVRHAELIGATQFSDLKWAHRDAENRLMPYEGDLQLEAMVAAVQRANPAVPIGIEVFSTLLYEIPAAEAAERAGSALRKLVEASEANIRATDGI